MVDSPSSTQMTCVLRLDTQTRGWDKSMHKLLKGIRDVTYTIDATRGMAYLSGNISPEVILRIRKAKKHAELIHLDYGHFNPPPPLTHPLNPFEIVPMSFNYSDQRPPYSPVYQPTAPMAPPYSPIYQPTPPMYYHQVPYTERHQPPFASSYYYYNPYYVPDVFYSPPPQIPTRDSVTGEPQCRIL